MNLLTPYVVVHSSQEMVFEPSMDAFSVKKSGVLLTGSEGYFEENPNHLKSSVLWCNKQIDWQSVVSQR